MGGQNVVRMLSELTFETVGEVSSGKAFEKSASNDTCVPMCAWAHVYKGKRVSVYRCYLVPVGHFKVI